MGLYATSLLVISLSQGGRCLCWVLADICYTEGFGPLEVEGISTPAEFATREYSCVLDMGPELCAFGMSPGRHYRAGLEFWRKEIEEETFVQ